MLSNLKSRLGGLDTISVGNLIKKYREMRGISLNKMANDINVTRATLYRYESNRIKKIPPERLESICVYLNIPFNQIIDILLENNVSEYRLDRFKSLYAERLKLEVKNEPDNLQNLIETLSAKEREKAYIILKQIFDQ